jgi:GTPase-activating protein SST2
MLTIRQDSVPKFFREPKYAAQLKERNFESLINSFASSSIS